MPPAIPAAAAACPSCGNTLNPGKPFCGSCGTKIAASDAGSKFIDPVTIGVVAAGAVAAIAGAVVGAASKPPKASSEAEAEGIELLDKCCIQLTLVPGVVARKVTEKEMGEYSGREGVIVSPGTILTVIADGRIVATLSGGYYGLPKNRSGHITSLVKEAKGNFIENVISWFRRKDNIELSPAISHQEAEVIRKAKHVSLVLMREAPFNLSFHFDQLPFADGIRSSVGIILNAKVSDPASLYSHALVSNSRVNEDQLADIIKPVLGMELSKVLGAFTPESFQPGPELHQTLPDVLKAALAGSFPGVMVLGIISATANGPEVEKIRAVSQQIYFDGRKIDQMERMNQLQNRLSSVENRSKLDQASSDQQFSAAMDAVNRDGLLSAEEVDSFKQDLEKRRMVREEEMDNLGQDRDDRQEDRLLTRSHALDLLRIDRQLEADVARFAGQVERQKQEHEIRRKELEAQLGLRGIELDISRTEASFRDERREKELEFEAKKRSQDINLQSQSRAEKIKAMADLQALREQREAAAHERELAARRLDVDADLQKTSIYAGMTFEQIMATNPNISAEAAKALAEKFKGDKIDELAKRREDDMEAERKRMEAMMDRMQQMAEGTIKQTANIASGQNSAHQKELERAAKSADERGSEIVKSVEKTLQSSAQVFSADARAKGPAQTVKIVGSCKSCQAEIEKGQAFCPECGEKVE